MNNFINERIKERWKPVKGYEGLYEISNLGRVKSFYHNWGKREKPLIMKQSFSRYKFLRLTNGKKKTTHFIHKLIAQAFIKNKNPKLFNIVNHKDANKLNNSIENLEWCDKSHDMQEARRLGLVRLLRGELAPAVKLTEKQVRVIKHLKNCRPKMTLPEVGLVFGVDRSTIGLIWNNKSWKHVII